MARHLPKRAVLRDYVFLGNVHEADAGPCYRARSFAATSGWRQFSSRLPFGRAGADQRTKLTLARTVDEDRQYCFAAAP